MTDFLPVGELASIMVQPRGRRLVAVTFVGERRVVQHLDRRVQALVIFRADQNVLIRPAHASDWDTPDERQLRGATTVTKVTERDACGDRPRGLWRFVAVVVAVICIFGAVIGCGVMAAMLV